jgi:hypothetical protein
MKQINRRADRPARLARIRRSFEGVVASYIRELSAPDHTTRARERGIATSSRT